MKKKKSHITISVITVSLNAAKTIQRTMESVASQDYEHIEYIVVDGKSTDGTVDTVKSFAQKKNPKNFKWISDKDSGIYEAMNRGTGMASGEYIIFMNADDYFYAPDVVTKAVQEIENGQYPDLLCGRKVNLCENTKPRQTNWELARMISVQNFLKLQEPLHHQAMFAKRILLKDCPFDTSYKWAGDFDWECRVMKKGAKCILSDLIVANYTTGGRGEINRAQSMKEKRRAIRKHFGRMCLLYRPLAGFAGKYIRFTKKIYGVFLQASD